MDHRAARAPIQFKLLRRRVDLDGSVERVVQAGKPSDIGLRAFNQVISMGRSHIRPGQRGRQKGIPGYVLHYVARGEYWHRVGGHELVVQEGQACLLDASRYYDQGNRSARGTLLWWVNFDGREASRTVAELLVDGPIFTRLTRARFARLFNQLWALMARRPAAYEARAHAVLGALFAELFVSREAQSSAARAPFPTPGLSNRIQAAVELIINESQNALGVKEIADEVGLSADYFAHRFQREVGMAPMRYLAAVRIDQARRLLATTDRPIAGIGPLVGIRDPGYFTRTFRRITGRTPRAYRKSIRREQQR